MDNVIIKTERDKVLELMMCLLELPQMDQEEVTLQVRAHGFSVFFKKFESFNFSAETKKKISDLNCLIQRIDGKDLFNREREAEI